MSDGHRDPREGLILGLLAVTLVAGGVDVVLQLAHAVAVRWTVLTIAVHVGWAIAIVYSRGMVMRRTEPIESPIVLVVASSWFISIALPFILSVVVAAHIQP